MCHHIVPPAARRAFRQMPGGGRWRTSCHSVLSSAHRAPLPLPLSRSDCWAGEPEARPTFDAVIERLEGLLALA